MLIRLKTSNFYEFQPLLTDQRPISRRSIVLSNRSHAGTMVAVSTPYHCSLRCECGPSERVCALLSMWWRSSPLRASHVTVPLVDPCQQRFCLWITSLWRSVYLKDTPKTSAAGRERKGRCFCWFLSPATPPGSLGLWCRAGCLLPGLKLCPRGLSVWAENLESRILLTKIPLCEFMRLCVCVRYIPVAYAWMCKCMWEGVS